MIDVTFSHENEKGKSNFREQALSEMSEAYDVFCKTVQMLDTSKEGKELWDQSKKAYEVFTSRIEQQLTNLLKQKLEKAGNANEMF